MRWTKEMLQYLTNNYNVLSISEIAKNMNLTKASVSCKASKLGLTKKDKGNEDIFANINNELSAYWLGFIYADGYIIKNITDKQHCNYELGIELCKDDICHLKKFNSIFNDYYSISTRKRSMNSLDELNNKKQSNRLNETCFIRIYNKKIVNDLIKNNIVQNKTCSKIFPIIENKEMFLHFLRGYIDGDGSYVIDNKNRFHITIQGNNKECFEFISKKILDDFNIHCTIRKDRDCWKLCIDRKQEVLELINLMFNNATIYLDRKYEKIINIKEAVSNRNIRNN